MRVVVIDTNVLVSALLVTGSFPDQIVRLLKTDTIQTRYSDAILAEYQTVLFRPRFHFNMADIQTILDAIIRSGIHVTSTPSTFPMPDESDRKFYDTAKAAGAVLITGNIKHFPDETFIVTPAAFMKSQER